VPGQKSREESAALQPGDVPDTWADTEALANDVGYSPSTPIETGVKNFVDWYLEFYKDQL
jgi:UDP-glucuronate 4-epimerase